MTKIGNETFTPEKFAARSFNYLNRMVDADCQPYFNIFMTSPAEAAHDWPDFGDVMSRQLQAAVFAECMTGKRPLNTDRWHEKMLSYIDADTGLLIRPETSYSKKVADPGDQALALFAAVTLYGQTRDCDLIKIAKKMTDSLYRIICPDGRTEFSWLDGFPIKSLMAFYRITGYTPAFLLAGRLSEAVVKSGLILDQKNRLVAGSHMHGSLRCLAGAADYALSAGDAELFSRIEESFRSITGIMTRFGFLPEVYARDDDIIACETCALMDLIGLGATLANNGFPSHWACLERVVRNHLAESQAVDCSWLESAVRDVEDTSQFTYRSIGERMAGGFSGWSSPNHILACEETLNGKWGGPELRDKTRAFQNCCGGSGVHAFFTAWKNASRHLSGTLYVNMHIDKLLPEAEIRCFQPYKGLLRVSLKKSCDLKIRIPDFIPRGSFALYINGVRSGFRTEGIYAVKETLSEGDLIEARYPLPVFEETVTTGNPGFRDYGYDVRWKGDTVTGITPSGPQYPTAYSASEGRRIAIYYGTEGPGLLYQREAAETAEMPVCPKLVEDKGGYDYYLCR